MNTYIYKHRSNFVYSSERSQKYPLKLFLLLFFLKSSNLISKFSMQLLFLT